MNYKDKAKQLQIELRDLMKLSERGRALLYLEDTIEHLIWGIDIGRNKGSEVYHDGFLKKIQ